MKQFYLLSTLLCALAISNPVSAQITIDEVKTDPSERILKNEVRPTTVDAQSYFSRARYRAERAAIRKERNTLEFGGGILGSVASYSDSGSKLRAAITRSVWPPRFSCITPLPNSALPSKPSSMPSSATTG